MEKLKELMKASISRGKRNRIKRKIARLEGTEVPELYRPKNKKKAEKEEEGDNGDDQEAIGGIEVSKEMQKMLKKKLTAEEQMEEQIKQEVKRNKKKRKQQKKEDDYDDIMKSFEDRINKRLKTLEEAGDEKDENEHEFDNVSVEED